MRIESIKSEVQIQHENLYQLLQKNYLKPFELKLVELIDHNLLHEEKMDELHSDTTAHQSTSNEILNVINRN